MPTNVKIVVSLLIILVGFAVFYFQGETENATVKWVALGLGFFMALSLWIFPEPKTKKPIAKNGQS